MKDYKKLLEETEARLKFVNRKIFYYRVMERRVGFTAKDREEYRKYRMLRIKLKSQVNGLTKKV